MNSKEPKMSIKKYMIMLIVISTTGFILAAVLLSVIERIFGLGKEFVIYCLVIVSSVTVSAVLIGFHNGCIDYYGLKGSKIALYPHGN